MRNQIFAIAGLGLIALTAGAALTPSTAKAPARACFSTTDWQGWSATADAKALYIRVLGNKIYRLDLASQCSDIRRPGAHLVTSDRNTGYVCSPVDLDLRVVVEHGFATPCIVSDMTQLSPAEAAALPRNLRP